MKTTYFHFFDHITKTNSRRNVPQNFHIRSIFCKKFSFYVQLKNAGLNYRLLVLKLL